MEKLQANQLEELTADEKTVFVFTTSWCGDCHYIRPFMPEIEEKFADFTFIEVDRDEHLDLAQKNNVSGIPSFITYNRGKEISRWISPNRKTQVEIEQYLTETNEKIKGSNK